MSSLVSLKTRLTSVTSTQKLIKAMELVASAKIKKAREKAQLVDFFQQTITKSMNNLSAYRQYQKLIDKNKSGKELYIVITSDMGLCGPYNTNIIKKYLEITKNKKDIQTIILGNVGAKKLKYNNVQQLTQIPTNQKSEEEITANLCSLILPQLEEHQIKNINIIYTEYISPLEQKVKVLDIFDPNNWTSNHNEEVLIEGEEDEIFTHIFNQYLYGIIYSTILKSSASEHYSRRNAMDTSNTNSLELMDELNLELNRIRQNKITQEISEIIGGSESSKKE